MLYCYMLHACFVLNSGFQIITSLTFRVTSLCHHLIRAYKEFFKYNIKEPECDIKRLQARLYINTTITVLTFSGHVAMSLLNTSIQSVPLSLTSAQSVSLKCDISKTRHLAGLVKEEQYWTNYYYYYLVFCTFSFSQTTS